MERLFTAALEAPSANLGLASLIVCCGPTWKVLMQLSRFWISKVFNMIGEQFRRLKTRSVNSSNRLICAGLHVSNGVQLCWTQNSISQDDPPEDIKIRAQNHEHNPPNESFKDRWEELWGDWVVFSDTAENHLSWQLECSETAMLPSAGRKKKKSPRRCQKESWYAFVICSS